MKKCPTCEKTFDDNLRFCQSDGTPLVDVAENPPIEDPYKTTVARPDEIASAIPPVDPFKTVVGGGVTEKSGESGDLLQLPEEHDPLKTMYVSEREIRKEMESGDSKEDVIDLSPVGEKADAPNESAFTPPEPPKFNEPNLSAPKFGDNSPAVSDSSAAESSGNLEDKTIQSSSENPFAPKSEPPKFETPSPYNSFGDEPFNKPTGPIPSPFDKGRLVSFDPPATPLPTYKDAEPEPEPKKEESNNPFAPTPFGQSSEPSSPFAPTPFDKPSDKAAEPNSPFSSTPFEKASEQNNQPLAQSDWTPPPAPEAGWQNQEIGQNTPFQPPPPAVAGQNQTLPIISLVLGIVSLCCYVSPLTGIAAIITGYLGMKNANTDPANYGGKTLAIVGMILGGLFFLIGIAYYILVFIVGMAGFIPQ